MTLRLPLRSSLAAAGLMAALATALTGCNPGPKTATESGGNTTVVVTPPADKGGAPGKKYRIAVVPKGTVHEFWQTVKAGAEAAGAENNAEIIWKGPTQETDIPGQIAIIEDMMASKVDALVMAACDSKALIPTAKKVAETIPVVTIDSGLDDPSVARCFVATDNEKGAADAAKTLSQLVGGKGTIGLISFVPGAATSTMRVNGFQNEIKKVPGIHVIGPNYCQSDISKAMDITNDMMTAHPDLAGIFGANEASAVGAARALEARGQAGKVKLVGFDAAQAQVEALKNGSIQALVVQNPYQMGYLGVKNAVAALKGETVQKRVDTGVTVVTKANLTDPAVVKLLNPLGKK